MAKLKLSALQDETPVDITVELPAAVYRNLTAYAAVFTKEHGQTVDPTKLVPLMLAQFMATDAAFSRERRVRRDSDD